MANSGADTNGTQFFVTLAPTRWLDFDHIIFGQLVRGWDVLSAIESKGTSGGTTTQDVIITKAQMVTNTTDAIARLRAAPNTSVPALGIQCDATVRVYQGVDPSGSYSYRSFTPIVKADASNSEPYIHSVRDVYANVNQPATVTAYGADLEGDNIYYFFDYDVDHHATWVQNNNILTITPDPGFVGYERVWVAVSHSSQLLSQSDVDDSQIIRVCWGEKPITVAPNNIVGNANVALASVQVCRFVDGDPTGTAANFQAAVCWGDGTETDSSSVVVSYNAVKKVFTVKGSHTYTKAGQFPITVFIEGDRGLSQKSKSYANIAL